MKEISRNKKIKLVHFTLLKSINFDFDELPITRLNLTCCAYLHLDLVTLLLLLHPLIVTYALCNNSPLGSIIHCSSPRMS